MSDSEKTSAILHYRLPFTGIAALSVTFVLAVKKKVTKEKLSAAPASMKVSAVTSGVLPEPADAEFCD